MWHIGHVSYHNNKIKVNYYVTLKCLQVIFYVRGKGLYYSAFTEKLQSMYLPKCVHLAVDGQWDYFLLALLWIMMLWTFLFMYFCSQVHTFLLGLNLEVEYLYLAVCVYLSALVVMSVS